MELSVSKCQLSPPCAPCGVVPQQPWLLSGWKGTGRGLGIANGGLVEDEAELQLPLAKTRADVPNKILTPQMWVLS